MARAGYITPYWSLHDFTAWGQTSTLWYNVYAMHIPFVLVVGVSMVVVVEAALVVELAGMAFL